MRKIIWIIILLFMLTAAPAAGAGVPADLRVAGAENTLWQALEQGWLHTEADGLFHPYDPVTGTAMAAMLELALGRAPEYNPGDRPVSRQEIAVMTVQSLGRDLEGRKRDGFTLLYGDKPAVAADKLGYVEVAVGTGVLDTTPYALRPGDTMSRVAAVELIGRAMGAKARTLVALTAGEWAPAEPLGFCATPDTRTLRVVVEPIPARMPEESGPIRIYLHNHTNLCNRAGETLKLPAEGWRLNIFPYLSTNADVGLPLLTAELPAPPAELQPGERVTIDVALGGGLAPGWYTAAVGGKEGRGSAFTGVLPIERNQAFYWQNFLVTRSTLPEYEGYSRREDYGLVRAIWSEYVEFQMESTECRPAAAVAMGRNFSTLLPATRKTGSGPDLAQITTTSFYGPLPGETRTILFEAKCGNTDARWQFQIPPIAWVRG